jgi:hypothetical protein
VMLKPMILASTATDTDCIIWFNPVCLIQTMANCRRSAKFRSRRSRSSREDAR